MGGGGHLVFVSADFGLFRVLHPSGGGAIVPEGSGGSTSKNFEISRLKKFTPQWGEPGGSF